MVNALCERCHQLQDKTKIGDVSLTNSFALHFYDLELNAD